MQNSHKETRNDYKLPGHFYINTILLKQTCRVHGANCNAGWKKNNGGPGLFFLVSEWKSHILDNMSSSSPLCQFVFVPYRNSLVWGNLTVCRVLTSTPSSTNISNLSSHQGFI